MSQPSIVITGAGIVSALGLGLNNTLNALRNGISGIAPVRYLDTIHHHFPVGEVKCSEDELRTLLHIKNGQITTRTSLLGIAAAKEALETSGLRDLSRLRVAFISGTTVGGMEKTELHYMDFLNNDSKNEYIAVHDCGICTEMIADYFGGFSLVSTTSTACSSAANAIILGAGLI
ncbi:MAG: beta-ketoacyl-[acyl-carrier-protein] synthase family protein, partial [Bacteroidales bacterium]|nr:beta-ketoacyl-[acyl-carrier-protein] synthase family protein [Bacteroidales bacterium]